MCSFLYGHQAKHKTLIKYTSIDASKAAVTAVCIMIDFLVFRDVILINNLKFSALCRNF